MHPTAATVTRLSGLCLYWIAILFLCGCSQSADQITPKSIVLGLGVERLDGCITEARDQIWYTSYPYSEVKILAGGSQSDFRYPRWSPDGNWIAYVESRPTVIDEWGQGQVGTGTDTVQIIHPDGTNRRIVSEPIISTINRAINGTAMMCYMTSGIRIPPVWSPDGRYLVFGQNFWPVGENKIYYSFYLDDVETGDTRMITTQQQYSNPVWLLGSNQFVFEGDNGKVAIATILSNGQVEIDHISFPPSVPDSAYVSLSYDRFDNLLVGNFRIENTEDPSSPPIVQLWSLDTADGTWEWKYSFDLNIREAVQFGSQYAVICDTRGEINLFDTDTGNILDLDIEPLGIEVDCATLQLITMDSNLETAAFYGCVDHGECGIWIGALQSNALEFRLIINDELITTLDKRHLDILEFSFSP